MRQRKWAVFRPNRRCAIAGQVFPGRNIARWILVAIGNAVIVDYLSGRMLFQDLSYLRIARKPVSARLSFLLKKRRVRGWGVEFRNRSYIIMDLVWIERGGGGRIFDGRWTIIIIIPHWSLFHSVSRLFYARWWGDDGKCVWRGCGLESADYF